MNIKGFNFPEDRNYLYYQPNTLLWIKTVDNGHENKIYKIGLPELVVKQMGDIKIIKFRSQNLKLKKNKPFIQISTKNKVLKFLSPFNSNFEINENLQNNSKLLIDDPYTNHLIICFNIDREFNLENDFLNRNKLQLIVNELLDNKKFENCKNCPDIFEGNVKRRLKV